MSGCSDVQREKFDKFSDLPDDVIDSILSLMPLRDAVKTGSLSTKWRLHWTRTQRLLFDWNSFNGVFASYLLEKYSFDTAPLVSIVGNILSSHIGPIREFYLLVPNLETRPHPDQNTINNWIDTVSHCGVQDLSLVYELFDNDQPFPTALFHCVELKHLRLHSVELERPHCFRKFSYLVSLDLICDAVSGETLTNTILNSPLLEFFSLNCVEIKAEDGPFILSSPKLKRVTVNCGCLLFLLKSNPNISILWIQQVLNMCEEDLVKGQDIVDFFSDVPNIEDIKLSSNTLMEWALQHLPERLPAALKKLKCLTVDDMDMSSLEQFRSMFCLINSSPVLQTMEISICYPFDEHRDTRYYLQSQVRQVENLRGLRTVKLTQLMGNEAEIIFIEIILSWCPILDKLYLISNSDINSEAEYKIMANIMQLRRASSQAEVIYSKKEQPIY